MILTTPATASPAGGGNSFPWQSDESLRRAGELIDKCPGLRAVTFDFFDTLVWRLAAKPTDVFVEAGLRLRQRGLLPDHVSEQDYEVLRRHAEWKAREHQALLDKSREDIALAGIFQQLKSVVPEVNAAAQIELAAEGDFCLLNPQMIEFARHAKGRGLKLFVISDIYLSAEQLRAILRANHFDPAFFDGIFTSSDAGVCKWTGNLFSHVLKNIGLKPEEIFHVGDNFHADVAGARKSGARGCHYVQATNETGTILEREKFLLGGRSPVGSANSLRLLAARNFPGDTDEGFFGRAGAMLLGPLLTRYASWACEQFAAAGVRKVGAFMREGEILAQLLQREAAAKGHALEIAPLYVNRKSTDMAAIGELTAENLIDWVGRRQTLRVQTILEHFGLDASELRDLPFSPDEKISTRERLLQFAKFLFIPEIALRIEQRSADERRKIMDYLRPWLDSGGVFGVCDIGYNATAQMQLKRILELEGCHDKMIGCYLITHETAARRRLDGLDVRHFLGAFGHPAFNHYAFLRSPAFIEQCIVAACGTTLGYERAADGSVHPVLDEVRFSPELLQRQRAFKNGVLHFQKLWLHFRAQKPGVLDGTTEFSRRLLADIDLGCAPILARAAAFPTQNELARFGSAPLDDYYFAGGVNTICGAKEHEKARKGYAGLLDDKNVHWPQGAQLLLHPRAAADFFTYARAMLLCQPSRDSDGIPPALTVIVQTSNPEKLRVMLGRFAKNSRTEPCCEIFLLLKDGDKKCAAVAAEFTSEIHRVRVFSRLPSQTVLQQINHAADNAGAPLLLLLDASAELADDWIQAAVGSLDEDTGATLATPDASCLVIRRQALVEALGFAENLSPVGANWRLLLTMRELGWQIKAGREIVTDARPQNISPEDRKILARRFPDFQKASAEIAAQFSNGSPPLVTVDWIGSFLDHGSLSHVNRELTGALQTFSNFQINRVGNGALPSPGFENLATEISATASPDAAVTVRHAWPPDWKHSGNGKLAVIQPWEFGALPEDWVRQARDVDEFWVPSNFVRNCYIESGVPAEKVFVVPNGVNAEKFHPQTAPMKLATRKKFKFLFVGGTIGRKGPDLLLQAFLKKNSATDDVCLVIKDFGGKSVYAGQTFESQIRAAQSLPNAPEILYLNEELSPDSLPGLYTACDCLVLPYRGEGFGLPVLEAMACGLPVIVTAGGATDDFVRDEFAWRVPAERKFFGNEVGGMKLANPGWLLEPNLAVLGEQMRCVFKNPTEARERGKLASRHAHQFFSWKNSAAIVAQRIRELAQAPAKSVKTISMPPVAQIGQLNEARELFRQKKLRHAWEAAIAAISKRPFHPEAFLLLAEIAVAAGDGKSAKNCAQHANKIAPGWNAPKQFLKKSLHGNAKLEWLNLPDSIRNPKSEIRNSLSVCLIVKNEEKFLAQCLKSVRAVAQQIIVVDTGSTDRTLEIAKEFGAEIYSHAWNDDFSAARNAALEHATGDWILILDADEELPEADHEKLRADMKNPDVIAYRLPLVNRGQEAEGKSFVPRLFRNAPGVYYFGRIHEQVFPSLLARGKSWGLPTRFGSAQLSHHGYTKEMVRDRNKIERNLKLLRQAIAENPTDANLMMNFGLELVRSDDLAGGVAKYREAFELMSAQATDETAPELREVLLTQFTCQLYKIRAHEEVVRVLNSSLAKKCGLTASLHFALGLSQFELKNYGEAAEQMWQCLAKRKQPGLSPINTDILTIAPEHCLALSLAKLDDAAGAEKSFQKILGDAEHENSENVKLDYAKFLADQNRSVEALQKLHEMVAVNARNVVAWRTGGEIALSKPDFLEFARDWTGEAMRYAAEDFAVAAQRAEVLMLSGDTAAAMELWERIWNSEREPRILAALILCEAVESPTTHAPQDEQEEAAASRAFIGWYRKLLTAKAQQTIVRLNEQTDKLSRALPGAAKILESTMAEVDRGNSVKA
ncbi:MAG TPA: glycosyltransferase [Verrucomicrobiae bacterium]|jgi:glycosyltransferase involved in cell wall biosynthesis/FMN phosphatase YigB (HAD superfamily)/Flp pilus assembly protein TadD